MEVGWFETQFAYKLKNLIADRKTEHSPLNAENNRGVANGVMFAYVHEIINILLSVLSIYLSPRFFLKKRLGYC